MIPVNLLFAQSETLLAGMCVMVLHEVLLYMRKIPGFFAVALLGYP